MFGPKLGQRKLTTLVREYYKSLDYRSLTPNTQRDYRYNLEAILACHMRGKKVDQFFADDMKAPDAQFIYNQLAERGIPFANHCKAVCSRLYNWAISLGYIDHNPWTVVRKKAHRPRREVWEQEQINLFLKTAYSQFKWRSVGLIVQMAYVWCQRLGDMSNLKWENYDFDEHVLYLEQSKRKARVELPTPDDLHELLVAQKEDMGFQPYVAPVCLYDKVYPKPYTKHLLTTHARKIMREAGLPEHLQIMDMRRTGITEMVDAGVGVFQIQAVTGHANAQSVMPYIKHTLKSATEASTARFQKLFDTPQNT